MQVDRTSLNNIDSTRSSSNTQLVPLARVTKAPRAKRNYSLSVIDMDVSNDHIQGSDYTTGFDSLKRQPILLRKIAVV